MANLTKVFGLADIIYLNTIILFQHILLQLKLSYSLTH